MKTLTVFNQSFSHALIESLEHLGDFVDLYGVGVKCLQWDLGLTLPPVRCDQGIAILVMDSLGIRELCRACADRTVPVSRYVRVSTVSAYLDKQYVTNLNKC